MARKSFLWLTVLTVCTAFMLAPALAADKVIKWKAATYWPASLLGYKAFEEFAQRVKDMTGGRLEIKTYPGKAIVPYNELLDATKSGLLQASYSWAGYSAGKQPAFSVLTDLTGAWNNEMEVFNFYYYGGGLEFLNKLYEPFGVISVGPVIGGMEVIPSTKPLRGPDDFKGIKIRSPEGMLGDFMQKMGASVVVLPSSDVYQALDKGVIDATDYSVPTLNYSLGLHKVAKYFNYPGFHSLPQGDFTVNKKAWEDLPADIQAILKTAVRDWTIDFSQRLRISDGEAVAAMKAAGATPIQWSEENLAKARVIVSEVWDEWAKKSPECAEAIELQRAFIKKLGR
jgi:TRAP-type mannitol/chloroaromatic compound transport system substrate-binding protein